MCCEGRRSAAPSSGGGAISCARSQSRAVVADGGELAGSGAEPEAVGGDRGSGRIKHAQAPWCLNLYSAAGVPRVDAHQAGQGASVILAARPSCTLHDAFSRPGPRRRLFLCLPGVPRPAAADQLARRADRCGARRSQYAAEVSEGLSAAPHRRGVRCAGQDLPRRAVRRVQGAPARRCPTTCARRSSRCCRSSSAQGLPLLRVPGVEADDVIGTLAAAPRRPARRCSSPPATRTWRSW